MKKAIAWVLLFTYFCASCTALIPIARDMTAHMFWHHQHMQQVHKGQKGRGHVAAEMAKLLDIDLGKQAISEGSNGPKFSLATHILPSWMSEMSGFNLKPAQQFSNFHFQLTAGIKRAVFLPPRQA